MSEIKVDPLTGKTTANDITVTVGATATMSLEQGLTKAWAGVTDTNPSTTINNSLNVSSLTDSSIGNYDYAITNSADEEMDAYGFGSMCGGGSRFIRNGNIDTTSSNFRCVVHVSNTAGFTDTQHGWLWIGDLA